MENDAKWLPILGPSQATMSLPECCYRLHSPLPFIIIQSER